MRHNIIQNKVVWVDATGRPLPTIVVAAIVGVTKANETIREADATGTRFSELAIRDII